MYALCACPWGVRDKDLELGVSFWAQKQKCVTGLLPVLSLGRGLSTPKLIALRNGRWHFKPQPLTGFHQECLRGSSIWDTVINDSSRGWQKALALTPLIFCCSESLEINISTCCRLLVNRVRSRHSSALNTFTAPISLKVKAKDPPWAAERSSTIFLSHPRGPSPPMSFPLCPKHPRWCSLKSGNPSPGPFAPAVSFCQELLPSDISRFTLQGPQALLQLSPS